MDETRFDHLARALSRRLSRRETTGVLSFLAVAVGLHEFTPIVEKSEAKGRKGKGKGKGKGHKQRKNKPVQCGGAPVEPCPAGTTLNQASCRCDCPSPNDFYRAECQRCLNIHTECCPGERRCSGRCIPSGECCEETDIPCSDGSCVPYGRCCPGYSTCAIELDGCCNALAGEECTQFDGCCNTLAGNTVCDGKWCCKANERCCLGSGCVPENQPCCNVDEMLCGIGIAQQCCDARGTCTTGAYDGQPRSRCCGQPRAGSSMTPCDGVCCEHDEPIICCPGRQNPCRAPEAGC